MVSDAGFFSFTADNHSQSILTDLCERTGNPALCLTIAAAAADRLKLVPPSMLQLFAV